MAKPNILNISNHWQEDYIAKYYWGYIQLQKPKAMGFIKLPVMHIIEATSYYRSVGSNIIKYFTTNR